MNDKSGVKYASVFDAVVKEFNLDFWCNSLKLASAVVVFGFMHYFEVYSFILIIIVIGQCEKTFDYHYSTKILCFMCNVLFAII